MFGSLLLLLGILAAMTLASWQIGLMLTAFAIAVVTIILWVQRIAVPYWKIARQASADLFGFVEERLSGTEDIRSSGAVAYAWPACRPQPRRLRSERRAALIGSGTWFAPIPLFAIGTAAGYLLAALFDQGRSRWAPPTWCFSTPADVPAHPPAHPRHQTSSAPPPALPAFRSCMPRAARLWMAARRCPPARSASSSTG